MMHEAMPGVGKRTVNRAEEISRLLVPFEKAVHDQARERSRQPWTRAAWVALVPFLAALAAIVGGALDRSARVPWETGTALTFAVTLLLTAILASGERPRVSIESRRRRLHRQSVALTGYLKTVRAEDRPEFLPCHVEEVARVVVHAADPRSPVFDVGLAYVLIETLEIVGSAEALPVLDALCCPPQEERLPESLHAAAARAARAIRNRIERERVGETLLRAAPAVESDSMLRPAQSGDETGTELLLRPRMANDLDDK